MKLTHLVSKTLALGIPLAALWLNCPNMEAWAQTAAAESQQADRNITLIKVVEVYEFEDMKVAVDQYQVSKGDTLAKILKKRGLLSSRRDEAKLMALVRKLNPEVKDFNNIAVGQTLHLPSILDEETIKAMETEAGQSGTTVLEVESQTPPAPSVTVTETVKVYDRTQPTQQSAKIVVMRHVPGQAPAPLTQAKEPEVPAPAAVQETPKSPEALTAKTPEAAKQTAPAAPEVQITKVEVPVQPETPARQPEVVVQAQTAPQVSASGQTGGPAAAQGNVLDFPSGNYGNLALEPASGVVYRTVVVRPGDSLERLLRREGMHRDLIYSHLLKVTMELNPEIKNPDLILAGAELRIPAAGSYLSGLAGVDPAEVRSAALARHERRRPQDGGAGAGAKGSGRPVRAASGGQASKAPKALEAAAALPDAGAESAKESFGVIFSRIGEKVDKSGVMALSSGQWTFNLDKAAYPVLELAGGKKIVFDAGSSLSKEAMNLLRAQQPPIEVFRTGKKESLERALGRLWSMCGYYRVYTKERTYEGGEDIRLKISADWMIWPTEDSWKAGQPVVVNRAASSISRTSAAWVHFLEEHGIKVIDINRNLLLPAPEASSEQSELSVVNLNTRNHTLFAAELVKALGGDPKVGVQIDLAGGASAPVLWEYGSNRVVLEFGEMPRDTVSTLQHGGYTVVSASPNIEDVISGVLTGFGFQPKDNLVLNAPAGGPKMSLAIKGRLVNIGDNQYFITKVALPAGMAKLMEPHLKVLKY